MSQFTVQWNLVNPDTSDPSEIFVRIVYFPDKSNKVIIVYTVFGPLVLLSGNEVSRLMESELTRSDHILCNYVVKQVSDDRKDYLHVL